MTEREAYEDAEAIECNNPCLRVLMIAKGVDLMRERGFHVPAWTIPDRSWVVLFRHQDFDGVTVLTKSSERELAQAMHDMGYCLKHKKGGTPIRRAYKPNPINHNTWHCPIHQQEGGAA